MPESVEDERVFSAWSFVENDLRSRLVEDHLNLCTRMYRQDWWTVHNFPYDEALNVWHQGVRRYSGQPQVSCHMRQSGR